MRAKRASADRSSASAHVRHLHRRRGIGIRDKAARNDSVLLIEAADQLTAEKRAVLRYAARAGHEQRTPSERLFGIRGPARADAPRVRPENGRRDRLWRSPALSRERTQRRQG